MICAQNLFYHSIYLGRLVNPCANGPGLLSKASEDTKYNSEEEVRESCTKLLTRNMAPALTADGVCLRDQHSPYYGTPSVIQPGFYDTEFEAG